MAKAAIHLTGDPSVARPPPTIIAALETPTVATIGTPTAAQGRPTPGSPTAALEMARPTTMTDKDRP